MTKSTLKQLRIVVPAAIFFALLFIVSKVMGFTNVQLPSSLKDALYNAPYIIVGVLYYISPLRDWANRGFHKKINENLRARLVMIAGLPDDPERYSWKRVKDVFYRRIDSDPSLGKRSEDIMTNGLIWTSLADVTILAVLFFIATIGLWVAGFERAPEAAVIMAAIGIASRLAQELVTNRHIEMGNDQLNYIEQYQSSEVADEMREL